ncbi:MAG: hypothetical protein IPO23_05460 [Flavobacterium sp.]|nr:hypothetical protein [Flavobacterium sp.]
MACYQTATFNPTTCVYDITGTQPETPVGWLLPNSYFQSYDLCVRYYWYST